MVSELILRRTLQLERLQSDFGSCHIHNGAPSSGAAGFVGVHKWGQNAGVVQLVERVLAKDEVVGSSPIARS